jgi:hypothetical protein
LGDLTENCVEMAVSKADPNYVNSEAKEFTLKYNEPYFIKFDLWEPYRLDFGFWYSGKGELDTFLRVVVARKIKENKYNYVASKLEAFYQDMHLECPEMNSGTYYMMIMIAGPAGKEVNVNLVSYKKLKGQLSNIEFKNCNKWEVTFEPFMKSALGNYSENANRHAVRELPASGSTVSVDEVYRKGGFGYVTIRAGTKSSLKNLRAKLNKK